MKKTRIKRLLIGLMFLSGIVLLLYPTVSNKLAERFHVKKIENYDGLVAEMEEKGKEAELQKAREYNEALTGKGITDPFVLESGVVLPDNYTSVLTQPNNMIGHLEIPVIDLALTVYHGTSEEVLQKGIGHMENTAFPIGGKGNHTILTGHTGLPAAKLFTDLTKVKKGDVFYITVLDTKLAYEVDQIMVVTPDDTDDLIPVAGEDYVTLVTCTPYAINSHRLLVRGTRIPYTAPEETAKQAGKAGFSWWMVVVAVIFLITLIVIVRIVYRRRKNRKREERQ